MKNVEEIELNEDFLVLINIENIATFPITLVNTKLKLNDNFELLEDSNQQDSKENNFFFQL